MRRTPCDHLDPTVLLLRRVMYGASSTLLLGGLAGCGGESEIPSYPARPFCVEGAWVPTSNLSLPQEVAYASLRQKSADGFSILSASGVPCEGASDARLCMAEIDRKSVDELEVGPSFLLTSDGDVVEAFQTLARKLSLLGRIDTPDEALLMVEHAGEPVACDTEVGTEGDGYGIVVARYQGCGEEPSSRTHLHVASDGTVERLRTVVSDELDDCSVGRRPPGLLAPRLGSCRASARARYFARASRLESASVDAFEILERELREKGLPRALRDALREAADDEVRHARDTARLAERFGERPQRAELRRVASRSLAEIARENALEGCTAETYGAYLAHRQAALARDPELRRVLMTIAREETRHAALSWQLAAFLEPQLDTGTRKRISAERRAAISRLGARLG